MADYFFDLSKQDQREALEYGRTTGEPHQVLPVTCDIAEQVAEVLFPRPRRWS